MDEMKSRISLDGKKIIIVLPEIKVLSNTIDQRSIKVLDEKNNPLNPIKSGELSEEMSVAEEEQLQKALNSGLLEKAEEGTKKAITKQLLVFDDYEVIFK